MIRNFMLLAGWVLAFGLSINTASADTFTATYSELARSPAGYAASWYSGAVTKDNKFIYGMGHSHASYNNNGLWTYDPVTNTHTSVFPDTGRFYRYDKDATGKAAIAKSGRWAPLDPVKDAALVAYFGGTEIYAPTNRNNHQAFYMPGVDQFWIMAGTSWDNGGWAWGGRFDLATKRWSHVSKPWSDPTKSDIKDFSTGMIAGSPAGWAAANAATAVCPDLDTVVLFGGMTDTWGTVRIIEPNPTGPEHYRWAPAAAKAPIFLPAENVRHNAACMGDTVYFVEGQRRVPGVKCCTTPDPAQFWKFHVPTRTWTRLPDGPPGGYFGVLTADSTAQALLLYGGSASAKLWAYDLIGGAWQDLTGTVPNLPRADMHTGGFIPGFGHVYKGGHRYDKYGARLDYTNSSRVMKIALTRVATTPTAPEPVPEPPPVVTPPPLPEPTPEPPPIIPPPPLQCPAGCVPAPVVEPPPVVTPPPEPTPACPDGEPRDAAGNCVPPPIVTPPPVVEPPPVVVDPPVVTPTPAAFTWTKIPLPGSPLSPQGSMKHQRLVEGPGGRVYLLGGDWGGAWGENSGRQEVYSFDPLSVTGDWRLEAPYCGTVENPVHWHTDEAGVAWDAKRGVFWKLAGTEYGPDDACLAAGKSVKAKVIQFNPTTKLWTVPAGFVQMRFGYVTNGLLDVAGDQMVQITDTKAFHLNLQTGTWASYPLPAAQMRFNAFTAQIGRDLWWTNRRGVMESYNLDTHKLTAYTKVPWTVPDEGWLMELVFAYGDKLLVVHPTSYPSAARHAALFDPATQQWAPINQGDGWGNGGTLLADGRLVLLGGGINGPADVNKYVWIGTLSAD